LQQLWSLQAHPFANIDTKLHHFREHMAKGVVSVEQVYTIDQLANITTKPLPFPLFPSSAFFYKGGNSSNIR
jgi:hypothetical protein